MRPARHCGWDSPGRPNAYLLATFSSAGQLLRQEAWLDDARRYDLQLDWELSVPDLPSRIIARDTLGNINEEWQLTSADAAARVLPLTEGWDDFILDDPHHKDAPYSRVRTALARYDFEGAARILSDTLVNRPQQPLLNLLLAWVDEFGGHPATVRIQLRQTLEAVMRSGAL